MALWPCIYCVLGDAYMVVAGHDEDEEKRAMGRPCERILRMACAMLDAVQGLTTPNGEKVGCLV